MSFKIPIPKNNADPAKLSTYCYIKADEDHNDLQDLFDGKYIKSQKIWRFPKNLEQQVYNFLEDHPAHHPNLSTYCYIKADEDHNDLQDLFGGEYIKSQEIWRFPKNLEQKVYNFLDCSSTESESDDINTPDRPNKKRRNRLHRANSFNASDDSNDECDSLDGNFRRRRQPIEKVLVESNKLKKEADKY